MELVTAGLGLILWMIIVLFIAILPIICLVSILKNEFKNNDKVIWLVVVVLIPFIGSVLYLFIGRKQRLGLNDTNTKA